MTKQTFEIIDGVYVGPSIWEGNLSLREYKDTLTSLGSLKKVVSWLDLMGCTRLTSLGSLKEVGGDLELRGCSNLVSLGSLTKAGGGLELRGCSNLVSLGSLEEVKGSLDLRGCTSLLSLGSLKEVGWVLYLEDCTSLTSLGSLKKTGLGVQIEDEIIPLQEVQEKLCYYSSLPLHDALNALLTDEVQKVPLYKNILLKSLQGEGIPSL